MPPLDLDLQRSASLPAFPSSRLIPRLCERAETRHKLIDTLPPPPPCGCRDLLTLNSWTTFVTDCHLASQASRFCKPACMDQIFLQADALGKRQERILAEEDKAASAATTVATRAAGHKGQAAKAPVRAVRDQERMLSRGEFQIALVLVGIAKYILPGQLTDVSEAVERLLGVDILSRLGDLVTCDPDVFRRCYCYPETTCIVLRRHEAALHAIFEYIASFQVAGGAGGMGGAGETDAKVFKSKSKVPTITLKEWLAALRYLEIIDIDLSERDALRCFSWSRMAVEDYQSVRGNYKNTVLPFEGFLEALCRVSAQKAMPTEREIGEIEIGEIESSQGGDVGAHLYDLKHTDVETYEARLKERRRPWCGEVQHDFPRAVEGVISIFLTAVHRRADKATERVLKRLPPFKRLHAEGLGSA